MDDYVSESARTIAETYDRTMADRYAEGTPQPDLDPEAWVDAAGGPRKGRVYGFGDSLDTTPVLSSYASSVAPPTYTSSSAAPPGSGVEEIRTLIREELWEELRTHFDVMVQQLISAMQGVRPSQPALKLALLLISYTYSRIGLGVEMMDLKKPESKGSKHTTWRSKIRNRDLIGVSFAPTRSGGLN
ncbi:hypothetical protein Taro_034292 [Colocasia esculenta]|uniref:Uncharacterized protein n=1 Tax=Colocasia esculenta TaxID=4460 RepID=A0A843WBI7_COLES|nr:hypothetical protein [Colocasia esculenta]